MATTVPAKLRLPDITRLLSRAEQLRAHKPAMAYWCEYAVVVHIMRGGLHQADDECRRFAEDLMDRLEQTKAARAGDENPSADSIAVTNSDVGQAMVESFARDTFARAERVMDADRVTRATADTFDAAATFFLVASAWGPLDADTQSKIKFAKWNAARILKAIREGRDPNESNPKRPEPEPEAPALDVNDPEVRMLMGDAGLGERSLQATVEDASDTEMPPRAMSPVITPAPAVVSPTISMASMSDAPPSMKLPGVPSDALDARGYFDPAEPFAPSPMSQSPGPGESSGAAPTSAAVQYDDPPDLPPSLQTQYPPHVPTNPPFARPSEPVVPSPMDLSRASPTQARRRPAAKAPPPSAPPPPAKYQLDEAEIAQAQKHAKWAISALNFEDVPTAVRELRSALAVLGSSCG